MDLANRRVIFNLGEDEGYVRIEHDTRRKVKREPDIG